jgi:hypothetical protein
MALLGCKLETLGINPAEPSTRHDPFSQLRIRVLARLARGNVRGCHNRSSPFYRRGLQKKCWSGKIPGASRRFLIHFTAVLPVEV